MIGYFQAYIKTIAAFLIFSVFAEMIMPDNKFKKYISIILGFLMIVTILKPVTVLVRGGDFDFANAVLKKENALIQANKGEHYYENQQNELVMEIYESELNDEIKENLAAENINVTLVTVKADDDRESKDYGNIESVYIKASSRQESSSMVKAVEPVEGYYGVSEEAAAGEKDGAQERKIKEAVGRLYQVPTEKITVEIQR